MTILPHDEALRSLTKLQLLIARFVADQPLIRTMHSALRETERQGVDMKKISLGMAAAIAVFASQASAAPLQFTFSDPGQSTFQLDSNPVSAGANPFSFTVFATNGTLNGASFDFGTVRFFSSLGGGGVFSEFGPSGGFGPQLFTGTTAAPVFSAGTFALTDFRGVPTTTLTISAVAGAVPEPATWAMMLVGFGGIGIAMRRHSKVGTARRYA